MPEPSRKRASIALNYGGSSDEEMEQLSTEVKFRCCVALRSGSTGKKNEYAFGVVTDEVQPRKFETDGLTYGPKPSVFG